MGIDLLPVLVQLGSWGRRYLPASDELSVRIEVLERGGPAMWAEFMDELREEHLDQAPAHRRGGPTVRERLEEAYVAGISRRRRGGPERDRYGTPGSSVRA